MTIEFSHKGSLVLDAATMSGMNEGHLCGQSCFSTCKAQTHDLPNLEAVMSCEQCCAVRAGKEYSG